MVVNSLAVNVRTDRPYQQDRPPLVIGATGGSGTRVIARIIQDAGMFLGSRRNRAEDAMEFVDFYDRWINRYVTRAQASLRADESSTMHEEFQRCIDRHRSAIPDADMPWGWKEPRSLYLLPYFHERYPAMKFLHVVRNGLDMAFSPNQNQLRKHGDAVLGSAFDVMPPVVRSGALWCKVNETAADYGETVLRRHYLRIRFEDLCTDSVRTTREILAFIEREPPPDLALNVTPPSSIGRWKAETDRDLVAALRHQANSALTRFGYAD